jgi:hypothetical protein
VRRCCRRVVYLGKRRRVRFLRRIVRVAGVCVVALFFCSAGCGTSHVPDTRLAGLPTQVIYPAKLTSDLLTFNHEFATEVSGTASTIAANTKDRVVREYTLRWKIAVIPLMSFFVSSPDPRRAFIDAWLCCVTMRRYFAEGGRGAAIFADQQPLAVRAAQALEERIQEVGRRHFGNELIERAKPDIEQHAERYPVTADFAMRGYESRAAPAASRTTFDTVLGLPLAPFRGFEGVGDTPSAINNFTLAARAFMVAVETLPERVRWQSELLLLEFDSLASITDLRKSLAETSASFDSLSKTASTLPEDVGEEMRLTLDTFADSQDNLRETLEEVQFVVEDLKEVLGRADGIAKSVKEAGGELTGTGRAFEDAAKAVDGVLGTYDRIAARSREKEAAEKKGGTAEQKSDAELYGSMAAEIRSAASELRALLNDLEGGKLKAAVGEVEEKSRASIDRMSERAEALVDRIAIRALLLIAFVFVAVVLYRVGAARMARRKG